MINSKNQVLFKILAAVIMLLLLAFTLISYNTKSIQSYDLSEDQIANLMDQYAEQQETYYGELIENGSFADCEFLGTELDGDVLYVYAHILWGEYVVLDERGFCMTGSSIPTKLIVDASSLELLNYEMPIDGEEYDDSLKALFPSKYYRKASAVDYDALNQKQETRIEKLWGVDIDDNFQLEIDYNGKYSITEITNDGSKNPADFDSRVIEEGQL